MAPKAEAQLDGALCRYSRQGQASEHARQTDEDGNHAREDDALRVHLTRLDVALGETIVGGAGNEVVAGCRSDRVDAPAGGGADGIEERDRTLVVGLQGAVLDRRGLGGDSLEVRKTQENKTQGKWCRSVVPGCGEARRLAITLWRLGGRACVGGGLTPELVAADGRWNERFWMVKVE